MNGGKWRKPESPFVKRKPGEYRPGKTKRDKRKDSDDSKNSGGNN